MASIGVGSAKPNLLSAAIFQQDRFLVRQKIFSAAPSFYLCDEQGNTLAYMRKKVFTLRDEIRIFTDPTQSFELLQIKARRIVDWGTAFDVTDSINRQKVGVFKRRPWKSLIRKEWIIMDANEQEIGLIQEDSSFLAVLRRLIPLSRSYKFEIGGRFIGEAAQNWNFFAPKMTVDFSGDPGRQFDRRMAAAAIILLMAVEGNQEGYD